MAVTALAVETDTARRVWAAGVAGRTPWPSMVARTRRGDTYSPPFATALYAASIWSADTDTPWPIGIDPMSVLYQLDVGRSSPADSPGKSMPVLVPKPKSDR